VSGLYSCSALAFKCNSSSRRDLLSTVDMHFPSHGVKQ
jgi:hypothetical protein